MNRIVRLIPVTRRGLNKLQQHGEFWEIRRTEPGMILLESMGKTFKAWNPELPDNTEMQTDWRWVNTRMDNDFDVEVLPREAMQHDNGKLKLDKNRRRLQGEEGIWNLDSDSEGEEVVQGATCANHSAG